MKGRGRILGFGADQLKLEARSQRHGSTQQTSYTTRHNITLDRMGRDRIRTEGRIAC